MSCASSTRPSCATSCASCGAICARWRPAAARSRPTATRRQTRGSRHPRRPIMPPTWLRITGVELDLQAIERRDFPIARRGYDPAAVDAHLSLLARHIEESRQTGAGAAEPSLAPAASSQVQSIIRAAENAAAEIERDAVEYARTA